MEQLSTYVIEFCCTLLDSAGSANEPPLFRLEELCTSITAKKEGVQVLPESVSRCLRHLRQNGEVKYDVVNRKKSLYSLLWVAGRAHRTPLQ